MSSAKKHIRLVEKLFDQHCEYWRRETRGGHLKYRVRVCGRNRNHVLTVASSPKNIDHMLRNVERDLGKIRDRVW